MKLEADNFKELEGKFNTLIVMMHNDSDKEKITIGRITDLILLQPCINERERVHLTISAMITLGNCQSLEKKRG